MLLLWYEPQIPDDQFLIFFIFLGVTQSSIHIFHSLKISCQSHFSFRLKGPLVSAPDASGSSTGTGSLVVIGLLFIWSYSDPMAAERPGAQLNICKCVLWHWERLNLFSASRSSPDWGRDRLADRFSYWLCLPQQIPGLEETLSGYALVPVVVLLWLSRPNHCPSTRNFSNFSLIFHASSACLVQESHGKFH